MKTFFSILFLCISSLVHAQMVTGRVVDSESKQPLVDVLVFVENSSISTKSGPNGVFRIKLPNKDAALVFDHVGYKNAKINVPNFDKSISVSLLLKEEVLDEIVIDNTAFTRAQMLKAFKYFFLGSTKNGTNSVILNEKDIRLFFDKTTNTFYADAQKPIQITNKNLGYKVSFYLADFELKFSKKTLDPIFYTSLSFVGSSLFEDISNGKKKVALLRDAAYLNSAAYFFYSLTQDVLKENDLALVLNKNIVPEKEYFHTTKNHDSYSIDLIKTPITQLKRLRIMSRDKQTFSTDDYEYVDEETNLIVFNRKTHVQSILWIHDKQINVDFNGNLINPNQVSFSGFYSEFRVGDMLPLDFVLSK